MVGTVATVRWYSCVLLHGRKETGAAQPAESCPWKKLQVNTKIYYKEERGKTKGTGSLADQWDI